MKRPIMAPIKSETRSNDRLLKPPTPVSAIKSVVENSTISFNAPKPRPAITRTIDNAVYLLRSFLNKGFNTSYITIVAMQNPIM